MEGASDDLLGSLGGGDISSIEAPLVPQTLKREQDSMDDFEHLDRDGRRVDSSYDPHAPGTRLATQSFLDTERDDIMVEPVRAPSVAERFSDQFADKFTDSESEVSASESPIHKPLPPAPAVVTAPAPAPVLVPEVKPVPPPEPIVTPPAPVTPMVTSPVVTPPVVTPPSPTSELENEPPMTPEPPAVPIANFIEAEIIFCQMGLDAWFNPQRLHPNVESLIYWRDPARSGAALGAGLALLVALACCSVVSVLAYVSLLALCAAVGFRIYKNVMQAVQKTNDGHPFKALLEYDIGIPVEKAQSFAADATAYMNVTLSELRSLFLVEDLVDSLKFGVALWSFTYVGACFNGITLIILGWIALFSLPKAYELNKAQVDANLELARAKINEISAKVRAAVPIGRKSESEKDK